MQKAAAWIHHHPDETTKIQVEKKYVAGDPIFFATVLKNYSYIPSVSGAYNTFKILAQDFKDIGIIGPKVDVDALLKNAFVTLANVPDSVK
jgi:NitT/TauT family transport system substrate-binding protein